MLSFFPRDILDEILNLVESVSHGFPYLLLNDKLPDAQSQTPMGGGPGGKKTLYNVLTTAWVSTFVVSYLLVILDISMSKYSQTTDISKSLKISYGPRDWDNKCYSVRKIGK